MKAIKFSRNELRVIDTCIRMTGGNEINEFVTDSPKLTETQTHSIASSITKKLTDALRLTPTQN
jgi:hypothetical protein